MHDHLTAANLRRAVTLLGERAALQAKLTALEAQLAVLFSAGAAPVVEVAPPSRRKPRRAAAAVKTTGKTTARRPRARPLPVPADPAAAFAEATPGEEAKAALRKAPRTRRPARGRGTKLPPEPPAAAQD